MSQVYYLCFCFDRLSLGSPSQELQTDSDRYKIELFKDNSFLGKTSLFQAQSGQSHQIIFRNSDIILSLRQNEVLSELMGELRLIKRGSDSVQELIGCYNFAFTNHIDPFKQGKRNCIDLCIELTQNYKLQFEVIVETSLLALQKLQREHLYGKKMSLLCQKFSETGEFRAQQLKVRLRRQSSKFIKVGNDSVILKTRFWSPQKQRIKKSMQRSWELNSDCSNLEDCEKVKKNGLTPLKLAHKATASVCSFESGKLENKQQSTMDEFDQDSNVRSQTNQTQRLYEIIQVNSKVFIPVEGNEYWMYKQARNDKMKGDITGPIIPEIFVRPEKSFALKLVLLILILLITGIGVSKFSDSIKRFGAGGQKMRL